MAAKILAFPVTAPPRNSAAKSRRQACPASIASIGRASPVVDGRASVADLMDYRQKVAMGLKAIETVHALKLGPLGIHLEELLKEELSVNQKMINWMTTGNFKGETR